MYAHIKHTNLSWYKLKLLIDEWVYQTPARVCARKIHVHRNTVNFWYGRIRQHILRLPELRPFHGEVEVDESYFGMKRPWVKGTGTADRVPVFGMRERPSGLVWASVVSGTDHRVLVPIIQERIRSGSIIYSDAFGAYAHLDKLGFRHHVVVHAHTYVTSRVVHTNGIESFWAFAKQLFAIRRGLPRDRYQLHLKEAQIRYNTRNPRQLRLLIRRLLRGTA
jgi:transposase